MATVAPPPVVRKTDWPTNEKTFRTEDEMVRGVYIQHSGSECM